MNKEQHTFLLKLARQSIAYGLEHGKPMPAPETNDATLNKSGACFVTLTLHGQLRGCIGALEAYQPLIKDVCDHAYAAAFNDYRFSKVSRGELDALHIEISVLSPQEEISFNSEDELLEKIVPNVDGLVLQEGPRKGTFLPLVWQSLPDKRDFLSQLKLKAGLPVDYWSDTIQCFRYTTEAFEE